MKISDINIVPQDTLNSIIRIDNGLFEFQSGENTEGAVFGEKSSAIVSAGNQVDTGSGFNGRGSLYGNRWKKKNNKKLNDTVAVNFPVDSVPLSIRQPDLEVSDRYNYLFDAEHSLTQSDSDLIVKNDSLTFTEKPAKEEFFESESIKQNAKDWLLGILLLSFFFFTGIRFFSGKAITNFFRAAASYQLSIKIFSDSTLFLQRISFLLNILFILNAGIFVYYLATDIPVLRINYKDFQIFLIGLGFTFILYTGKFIVVKFIGFSLNLMAETNEYLKNIFLFNKIFGLIVFPLLVAHPFIDIKYRFIFIYAGIFIFVLLFILRIFRGIVISVKNKFSIFYIILYLCTLEILPVLIFYKLYNSYIGN